MSSISIEVKQHTRLCTVKGELGVFHLWEQYSEPLRAEVFIGGAPAGVYSRVYGIVEFGDRVRRVEPSDIIFCDEENHTIQDMEALKKKDAEKADFKK